MTAKDADKPAVEEHRLDPESPSLAATNNRVTVCICTFRRPAIIEALMSVGAQRDVSGLLAGVVVIDNDETDELRDDIVTLSANYPFALRYVHAPAKNISIARNAALDTVETRWLAFMDDDEIASPGWLAALVMQRDHMEVVVGRSVAQYSRGMPGWVRRCDFHSNTIGKSAANAYTSNVLINVDFIRSLGIKFLEKLGRTGGEDTMFFRHLEEAGARFAYAPEAIVEEVVPPVRANMKWVMRRMYRAGQTHGLVCQRFTPPKYRALWITAAAKLGVSALMALLTLPGSDSSRKWLARACLHGGALHFRIRNEILEEYG